MKAKTSISYRIFLETDEILVMHSLLHYAFIASKFSFSFYL